MKKLLRTVLDVLFQVEKTICALGFAVMTFFVLLDIFSREVLSISFPWAQKSAVYLMIGLGFIGAALTSSQGKHLRPEIADQLWKGKTKIIVGMIEQLVIASFCLTMAYVGTGYVIESKSMGDVSVVTGIPLWIVQVVIPYAFASMSIRHLIFAFYPKLRPVVSAKDHK